MTSHNQIVTGDLYGEYEYRLKNGIAYYSTVRSMLSGVMVNKDIVVCLKLAMPQDTDVLDYNHVDLKYYIDKCIRHNVALTCSIKNYSTSFRPQYEVPFKKRKFDLTDDSNANIMKYIICDWVNIGPFLDILCSLRKGEQHRMCMQLISKLNDKWHSTYLHNTNKSVCKLVELFAKLNIVSNCHKLNTHDKKDKFFTSKFTPQMFEEIFSLPSKIRTSCENFDATCANVDVLTEKMNMLVNDLQKKFSQCTQVLSIVTFVAKMISLSYLLMQPQNQTLANISALLLIAVPSEVLGHMSNITTHLTRALQDVINKFVPGFMTQGDEDNGIILSFFNATKMIFGGMFTSISPDYFKKMQLSVNKMKILSDYIKHSKTIVEFVAMLLEKLIEILGDKVLNYYGYLPQCMKDEQIADCIKEFLTLKEMKYDISCKFNKHHCQFVYLLHKKLINIEAQLQTKAIKYTSFQNCRVMPFIRVMIVYLERVLSLIPPGIKDECYDRKSKPYWLYIHGDPRVGKSAVFQPYIISRLANALKLIPEYMDPNHYTFTRTCGMEFWEQYNNQPVIQYNDLLQNFADEQAMHKAVVELTNVVDDAPYPLNMAALESKGCCYFTSGLVVSNAQDDFINQGFIANKCWSQGKHLYARRNCVVKMCLSLKYQLPTTKLIDFNKVHQEMLDSPNNNVGDLFPQDMYTLLFTDPVTGVQIQELPFLDGLQWICNDAVNYANNQTGFKKKLLNHLESIWVPQSDEVDNFEPAIGYSSFMQTGEECECLDLFRTARLMGLLDHIPIVVQDQVYEALTKGAHYTCVTDTDEVMDLCEACIIVFSTPTKRKGYALLKEKFVNYYNNIKQKLLNFYEKIPNWAIFIGVRVAVSLCVYGIITLFSSKKENIFVQSHESTKHKTRTLLKRNEFVPQSYDNTNKDIENRIDTHFVRIHFMVKMEDQMVVLPTYGHGICIGSDIFCIPKHYYLRFEEYNEIYQNKGVESYLQFNFSEKNKINVPYVQVKGYLLQYEHTADIAFIRIPDLCCMRDITHFFCKLTDTPNLFGCYLYGFRSKRQSDKLNTTLMPVGNVKLTGVQYSSDSTVTEKLFNTPLKKMTFKIPQCYMYDNCFTSAGDCGMMLIHVDASSACRRVLGMHTAGSDNTQMGITSPIYYEDLIEVINHFNINKPVILPQCETEYMDWGIKSVSDLLQNANQDGLTLMCRTGKINGKPIKMTLASKSRIRPSVVQNLMLNDFGPNTQAPARLFKYEIDGCTFSPMYKALQKMSRPGMYVHTKYLTPIIDHISDTVMSWQTNFVNTSRLLTDFESVNGMVGLNPLDMRTSPGFPYTLLFNKPGKSALFTSIEDPITLQRQNFMTDFLYAQVCKRELLAKQGFISETYFVDTMKDETRLLDKVLNGKTRIFQVGPVDLSILMRKYCGYFIAHCHASYMVGEMAIGINPNSIDWTLKLRSMLCISNRFINGDYSNYDASLWHQLCDVIITVMNNYYNDSVENQLVRAVLVKTCMSTFHIIDDAVLYYAQGNPSGNVLTTIINILANMFMIRYAYMRLVSMSLHTFTTHINAWFYGDDNLIAVHVDIIDQLNMLSYAECMKELGMEYTTPDKSQIVNKYYSISEIDFLKRHFVKDVKLNFYKAQLNYDVIMEIARWSESDPLNMEDQLNRFNTVLLELANYDKDIFMRTKKIFKKYCMLLIKNNMNIDVTRLFNMEYCLAIMYPLYYTHQHHVDLEVHLKGNESSVQHDGGNCEVGKLSNYIPCYDGIHTEDESQNTGLLFTILKSGAKPLDIISEEDDVPEPQTSEGAVRPKTLSLRRDNFETQSDEKPASTLNPEASEFIPQSAGSKETVAENKNTTKIVAKTTTFYDENTNHAPPIRDSFCSAINSMPTVDIMNFVKRPKIIKTHAWTNAQTIGTQLFTVDFPLVYFQDAQFVKKFNNIQFWRPSFQISIRVNGTKMHYGRLMFCWMPQADALNANYKFFENASSNNWYQVSANSQQVVSFNVPYTHYKERLALRPQTVGEANLFTLYCYVSVPLQIFSGTASPIDVTVFSEILDPQFTGFTHDTFSTQSDETAMQEAYNRTKAGTVVTRSIAGVAQDIKMNLDNVVDLGAAMVNNIAEMALPLAGLAIAPNLELVQPMHHRQPRWFQSEDTPNSLALAAVADAAISKNFCMANSHQSEMTILEFCSRPALISYGTITSSSVVSSDLFYRDVSPAVNWCFPTSAAAPVITGAYGIPMQFVSRYFNLWRGSIKYHISFIASPFHSCRLRLTYNPVSQSVVPDLTTGVNDINIVMDINQETEYSFVVPYMQETAWSTLTNGHVTFNNNQHTINGQLQLQLINTLAGGAASFNPIYFQVFASAGPDLQFAGPKIVDIQKRAFFYYSASDEPEEEPSEFTPQMFETGACEYPSSSMQCLKSVNYPVLGGVKNGIRIKRVQTAYEVTSLKQLANMISVVFKKNEPTEDLQKYYGMSFSVGGVIIPSQSANFYNNYMLQMMSVFRYVRGGIRATLLSSDISGNALAIVTHPTGTDDAIKTFDLDFFDDTFDLGSIGQGFAFFPDSSLNTVDVIAPYLSKYNSRLIQYVPLKQITTPQNDESRLFIASHNANGNTTIFGVGAADDFLLGFQLCIPKAIWSLTDEE